MFDPVRICSILNEERVDYVVVGGFAAARPLHGTADGANRLLYVSHIHNIPKR